MENKDFENVEEMFDFDWDDVPGEETKENAELQDKDVGDSNENAKDEEEKKVEDEDIKSEESLEDWDEGDSTVKKEDSKEKKDEKENVIEDVLKELGIEGTKIDSPTDVKELIEEKIEKEVNERILQWAEKELDEDAKAFIKFKKSGGKTEDFFKKLKQFTDITSGDIEDEEFQEKVIREQLKKEGWDEEEIEDRIIFLQEKGSLEKVAKRYYEKIKQKKKEELKKLEKEQEEREKKMKEQERIYKQELKKVLSESEDFYGINIPAKERTKIYSFINSNDIELEDGTKTTKFRLKLLDVFREPKKLITLAYLLDKDLDLSKVDISKRKVNKTDKKENVKRKIADLDDIF